MLKNIKVSIIMATYNTDEKFLKSSINSILKQSYNNFEFIIINDGGKDLEIIKEFNDERIIIINHKTKKGLPFSLNEAIEKSKGKYIARMDSDDISLFDRIENQVKYMEKNKNCDMCSMFHKKFGINDELIIDIWNNNEDVKCQLFYTNVLAHPVVMFRKKFLTKNKLKYSLDFIHSQDYELWTRISKLGNIQIIPKLGLFYRMHNKQISIDKEKIQKSLYEKVLIRNLSELDLSKSNLKYLKMLNGNCDYIDFYKLSDFIDEVIKKNKICKIYNEKSLKKVLNNRFFILAIKNKFFAYEIIKKRQCLRFYNLNYLFKKIYYTMSMNIYIKRRKDIL